MIASIRKLQLWLCLAVGAFPWHPIPSGAYETQRMPPVFQRRLSLSEDALGPFSWKFGTFPYIDDPWSREFGLPSVDGLIYCAVKYGNDLIVGGSFREIGGVEAHNIARWDGAAWHSLGEGPNREVTSMAVYHGALLVGGRFQYVDGQLSLHLAKWDGTSWTPMGASRGTYFCCYEVNAIAVYRDELIVAGDFGDDVEPELRGIRRWDGTTWQALGTGVDGPVQALLADGDSLYVAGQFGSAGGGSARGIALWDGNTWEPLGSGIPYKGWGYGVRTLTRFQDQVFAGGDFDSAGGVPTGGLASWNGVSWSAVDRFSIGWTSTAMVVHDGLLDVASFPGISRWNGQQWTDGPRDIWGEPWALLSDGSDLIAAGDFSIGTEYSGPVVGFDIARWDGQAWNLHEPWNGSMRGLASGTGHPAGVRDLAVIGGRLAAAGFIDFAGTGAGWKVIRRIATWDGSEWNPTPLSPTGYADGIPEALLGEGDTLYAAGQFITIPGGHLSTVLRWQGQDWAPLDTMTTTGSCLFRYHDRLILGTRRTSSSDPPLVGIFAWNGTSWDPIGRATSVDEFAQVVSMTEHEGLLVVVGSFTSIEGVDAKGVAAWDGASWRSLGPGPPHGARPQIWDIESYGGRVIVAGLFSGGPAPLMTWDGATWRPLPGIAGDVSTMRVIRGRLYVGGDLRLDSGEEANVAIWDGEHWTPFGSGVNGWITALCEFDGELYLGGGFSRAGGASSFGIARRASFQGAAPRPTLQVSQGRPNPFRDRSDFSFRLDRSGDARVSIHDCQGREIAVIEKGQMSAGTFIRRWDGRDASGKPAPAGIYFITVRSPSGAVASRKIVRVR